MYNIYIYYIYAYIHYIYVINTMLALHYIYYTCIHAQIKYKHNTKCTTKHHIASLLLELLEGQLDAIRLELLVVQSGLQIQGQLVELLELLVELVALLHDQAQGVLVLLLLLQVLLHGGFGVLGREVSHHLQL